LPTLVQNPPTANNIINPTVCLLENPAGQTGNGNPTDLDSQQNIVWVAGHQIRIILGCRLSNPIDQI
jgi:hypothetical protein